MPKKTKSKTPNDRPLAAPAGSPRLFEVEGLIRRTAVILATSEEDALKHVKTWEQAWNEHSDLIEVMDPEVTVIRPLKVAPKDWEVEAHDITCDARKLIEENTDSATSG